MATDRTQHIITRMEAEGINKETLDELERVDPVEYTRLIKRIAEGFIALKDSGKQYRPEVMELIGKCERWMEAYREKMN